MDKSFTYYYFTEILEIHMWPCTRGFLSTVDASLDGLHISLEISSGDLLRFGWRGSFSSHSVYTRLMERHSSEHWVCLFLQGEFPAHWTFGENLRTPPRSQGFFFLVFFVRHFSGGVSKVVSKIYLLPIYARADEVFPCAQSSWSSPLLLLGC